MEINFIRFVYKCIRPISVSGRSWILNTKFEEQNIIIALILYNVIYYFKKEKE